jgi:hypothetical protein
MGHTWTLLIWTAQAAFDVGVWVLLILVWLGARQR